MARFDLDQIESFMDDTPEINIALPTGGAYLLQCALSTMDNRWQWIDDGDPLTDGQWDELQADIAALMLALITEVNGVPIPIGMILPYISFTPPDGFLYCDGEEYLRVDYPLLYAVLPAIWIIDADNFEVPDLQSKFSRGAGDPGFVGLLGGEDTHALTIAELPQHYHLVPIVDATGDPGNTIKEGSTGDASGLGQTLSTGGDLSHNNIPAFMSLPYYIRAE